MSLYQKTVLPNGIRILTERIPHFHSVSTGIWVNVGSRDEQGEERGITHFIEHMLFKGTVKRSAKDIARELDAVGGFANAFTSKEQVCFHAKVLHPHLPLVVDVLTDIFLNSVFAPVEIAREQQVIVQEIRMIEDTPDEYIHILFQEMFWKDNPLGIPIYGTVEAVESINRGLIQQYLSRMFQPARIVVAAAGNLDHQHFIDLVAPVMEELNHPKNPLARRMPGIYPNLQVIPKDLEQVHLCLGMPGPCQSDDNRFPCHLLNVVLGSSMSSRLFQEIREKRGLAYSIYSFVNSHEDTGLFGIYAGVGAEHVRETLDIIHEQLSILLKQPISQAELKAAKEYLKGNMYLNAESTDSRMNRLAKNEFLFGRYIPYEEVEQKIDEVTAISAKSWFEEVYQPSQIALMLLGPVEQDPGELANVILAG
jgi:predicted Zn-dependent peptidase